MTARELLDLLDAAGVRVTANGDRLVLDAPRGVLTVALLEEARAHKAEMLALVPGADGALVGQLPARVADWPPDWAENWAERSAIQEYDGGLPREVAEREAEACVRAEYARTHGERPPEQP